MNRNARIFSCLSLALALLGGCSNKPPASEGKKPATPLQKVQGKVRLVPDPTGSGDSVLNGGGPAVFLWEGKHSYRLFSRKSAAVVDEGEYIVEGVNAQKVIDEIGDPAQGKGGYPLLSSCERVVKMAWSGMSFEENDVKAGALRRRVGRYPARPVILVVRLQPVAKDGAKKDAAAEEKEVPTVAVPADKQRASLIEGSLVQAAPLWEPAGGPVRCKVVIDAAGKVSELETGAQLCEYFNWDQVRYKPLVQRGVPVQVRTEVEVNFDPRK
jgi:hypothetical protein